LDAATGALSNEQLKKPKKTGINDSSRIKSVEAIIYNKFLKKQSITARIPKLSKR